MDRFTVGIDWACDEHAVCVLDEHGKTKAAFSIAHTREGLAELVRRLARIAAPAQLAISIERPSGLLVDVLVDGPGDQPVPAEQRRQVPERATGILDSEAGVKAGAATGQGRRL